MPIYEFTCTRCEKDFELMCPMGTQVNEVKCPDCNQNHLIRKMSLFSISSGAPESAGFESAGECGSCGPSGCGCH